MIYSDSALSFWQTFCNQSSGKKLPATFPDPLSIKVLVKVEPFSISCSSEHLIIDLNSYSFSVTVALFPNPVKWFNNEGISCVSGASVKLWNTHSVAGQLFFFFFHGAQWSEKSSGWDKVLYTLMVYCRYSIKKDPVLLMEKKLPFLSSKTQNIVTVD